MTKKRIAQKLPMFQGQYKINFFLTLAKGNNY